MGWKKIKVQKIFTTLRDTWENVIVVSQMSSLYNIFDVMHSDWKIIQFQFI